MSKQQQGTPSNTVQPAPITGSGIHFHSPQLAFTDNTSGCAVFSFNNGSFPKLLVNECPVNSILLQ
jgi:hypothetical protein